MRALRIGILGDGHLARTLVSAIDHEPHVDLIGSWGRSMSHRVNDLTPQAIDLLVEVATQEAVRDHVVPAVAAGVDTLILSVGALADPDVRARLAAGPGHAIIGSGAIGGLDYIRGLRTVGPITAARIETRKLPATLIQTGMDPDLVARLEASDEEIVLLDGTAEEAVAAFPRSANVAATVALAADAWGRTTARVVADPAAIRTVHRIEVDGAIGRCALEFDNDPSPMHPRSSEIVAWSVLRAIHDFAAIRGLQLTPDLVVL